MLDLIGQHPNQIHIDSQYGVYVDGQAMNETIFKYLSYLMGEMTVTREADKPLNVDVFLEKLYSLGLSPAWLFLKKIRPPIRKAAPVRRKLSRDLSESESEVETEKPATRASRKQEKKGKTPRPQKGYGWITF